MSIYCQLWTAYIWLCIYTVNEVNLWRSPQHAAFDAANSSLLLGSRRKQTRICYVESSMLWTPPEVNLIYRVYTKPYICCPKLAVNAHI